MGRTEPYKDWMDDDLRYSTESSWHGTGWRPDGPRYTSARDAVDHYHRLQAQLEGQPGIDYERVMGVDTSPAPENPANVRASEFVYLRGVFERAHDRVAPEKWRVWGAVRFDLYSLREAARLERKERRREIHRCIDRDALRAWASHYNKPFPDGAEDPWDLLADDPGIQKDAARYYRDEVDAAVEQLLVGEHVLIKDPVRRQEDARPVEAAA